MFCNNYRQFYVATDGIFPINVWPNDFSVALTTTTIWSLGHTNMNFHKTVFRAQNTTINNDNKWQNISTHNCAIQMENVES